jgi:hypothetical protein
MEKNIQKLSDYCRWNKENYLKQLFSEYDHGEIDLLTEEGKCFFFAIKYQNVKMLQYLLDYYQKHFLSLERESMTYKMAQWRLKECLKDVVYRMDESTFLPEISDLLKPFTETMDTDSDEELDQMLDFYDADANANI